MSGASTNLDHVSAILEASYRYASTPDDPDILFNLAALVSDTAGGEADEGVIALVERHFELAAQLAEQIGTGAPQDKQGDVPDAVMAVGADLSVRALGAQARALMEPVAADCTPGSRLRFLDPVLNKEFAAAAKRILSGSADNFTLRFEAEDDGAVCFGYLTREGEAEGVRIHFVSPLGDGALNAGPLRDLGISPAEMRLLEHFQDGLSLREAAAALGISYHTARNQLRSIFDKFGVNRQSDLVRYLTVLAALGASDKNSEPLATPDDEDRFSLARSIAVYRAAERFRLRDGREIGMHVYGPDAGRPVVMINSPLSVFIITRTMWQALYRRNIRLVSLHRPGFGASSPVEAKSFDQLRTDTAEVAERLTARLGTDRLAVMGFSGSSSAALSVAEGLGPYAGPLGLVAPQFQMDPQKADPQRFSSRFFRDSLSAPWAMEFGLSVFRTRLSSPIVGGLVDRLFRDSPVDKARIASDPELRAMMIEASKIALESPARAILQEAELMRQGRDPRETSFSGPMIGWHGSEDGISPPPPEGDNEKVSLFDRFSIIEGGGHLIFASHFDSIIDDLFEPV